MWIAAGSLTAPPATTYSYDPNGNVLSTTDPDGHTSWTKYDALNRPVRSVTADGSGPNDTHYATTTTYDAVGNTLSVTDPDGNVTSYSYDRLNRQVSETNPLHYTSATEYDADGNVIQTTDFDGQVIQYVYNAVNEQVEELWLNSSSLVTHMIQTTYDAAGQVISVAESDANNATNGTCYQYAYDFDGRMTSQRMAPDAVSSRPTLENGQLNGSSYTLTWSNGSETPYEWFVLDNGANLAVGNTICVTMHADTFDPVVAVFWWNGTDWIYYGDATSGGNNLTFNFTIPSGGGVPWALAATAATMVNGNFALQWQVDPSVVTAVPTAFTTLAYTYYADGSVHTVADTSDIFTTENGLTTYAYDHNGNMTSAVQSGGGVAAESATMGYNANGSISTITRDAGSTFVAASTYSYDGMGRTIGLQQSYGASSTVNYSWQYDAASNVLQAYNSIDNADNYTVDKADQVTDESLGSMYSYDQNGNKTGGGYVTGADNRLLSDGTYNYVYDNNGNLIQQISGSNAIDYTWDFENRLVGVAYYTGSTETKSVAYTYDPYGNLVSEAATVGGVTTYQFFAYGAGQAIVQYNTSTGSLAESDRYLVGAGQTLTDDQIGVRGTGVDSGGPERLVARPDGQRQRVVDAGDARVLFRGRRGDGHELRRLRAFDDHWFRRRADGPGHGAHQIPWTLVQPGFDSLDFA